MQRQFMRPHYCRLLAARTSIFWLLLVRSTMT